MSGNVVTLASANGPRLLPLKRFQADAQATALFVLTDTSTKIEAALSRRHAISLAQGVTLLRSPTGSGKTITIGRILEQAIGALPRKTCWFWFTPYSGLVLQTREALDAQCPGLRLRDVKTDRFARGTRDGDVFVMTWASVASANRDARLVRQEAETVPSIDVMVAALRADGWYVGAVIDEAHVNFGTTAKQAASFYLDVLRPDFTFLVTATPKDEELERFEKLAGIEEVNRIEISREDVVRACLNKVGVKAVHFRAEAKDERLLDMEEVAIFAGLERHRRIKAALAAANIDLTPLLLIQVDNAAKGQADPVQRVRDILKAYQVPADSIAVHTSGEPDPYFHTLAYDETKEILVFKVAAATGFDAPRAWTLVSLRQTVGIEFGLQILGRIMRVHPRLQGLHPFATNPPRSEPSILDFGYVFLANPAQQAGIATAAAELKAIRDSIETVTDNVVVVEFGNGKSVLLDPDGGFSELLDPPEQENIAVGQEQGQPSPGASVDLPPERRTHERAAALRAQSLLDLAPGTGIREPVQNVPAPPAPATTKPGLLVAYPLRTDIEFPRKLAREVMPKSMDGMIECMAKRIAIDDTVITLVNRTRGKVLVTEEDVFGTERTTASKDVPISTLRIAQQAQLAFRFNDSIDERDLKPALAQRLQRELDNRGLEPLDERGLRRAVDLLAMARPHLLHDAARACLAQVVEIRQDEEIPPFYQGPRGLPKASKSLYQVFPTDMNREERAFAQQLDDDQTGTVQWWLRNVSMASWAVSIVLPNGERHFPDFVIGVDARRRSKDGIALVEVKDDGRDGRLFATKNTDKVRTSHRDYRSALMVFRDQTGEWFNVVYRADIQRHHIGKRFEIADLLWTE